MEDAGCPDDPLGRHAPYVQAVSSHGFPLDKCDLRAQSGSPRGGDEPGRPRPDDHEVVAILGGRILPSRRVDIFSESPVFFRVR